MMPPSTDSFFSRPAGEEPSRPWRWRYLDADGAEIEPADLPTGFPSQADAESWLGEEWRALLAAGVEQVSLYEEGREVYGAMSLRP